MEEARFGIVTPSRSRRRFIPSMVQLVKDQTRDDWVFVYVQDGPDARSRRIFADRAGGDTRMRYLETDRWTNDWGVTPRLKGVESLQAEPKPPEYIVFWDDDNYFHPRALQDIQDALEVTGRPDLLLVPIRSGPSLRPVPGKAIGEFLAGDVDTANFVVRLDIAVAAARTLARLPSTRGSDYRFFDKIRSNPTCRIEQSEIEPIGDYDGLRPFARLRWKLRIPPLNIGDAWWWRRLRKMLRG